LLPLTVDLYKALDYITVKLQSFTLYSFPLSPLRSFARTFVLPDDVNFDFIRSWFNNNDRLTIEAKKKRRPTNRAILIEVDPSMQIFIKTFSGKTITLDIGAFDAVETLRAVIQEREGIPRENLRSSHLGRKTTRRRPHSR
ncbi:hypothetical protein PMAYCL1PPCAC_10365, partial [Pristionchus mayeri]